ncbi:MAG: OmpH family outer membrane protein [Nitrospinales bacterium]
MNTKSFYRSQHILMPLMVAACLVAGNFSQALAASPSRIGFVDLQKAVSSTREWKRQFAAFKKEYQKEQKIIQRKEKRIKKILEDLSKQSYVLDPTLKSDREKKFREQKREFERYVKDRNEDFAIREREASQKIIKKMVTIVQKIGKDKKFSFIMDQSTVIYFSKDQDLTDLAIKAYDRTYK